MTRKHLVWPLFATLLAPLSGCPEPANDDDDDAVVDDDDSSEPSAHPEPEFDPPGGGFVGFVEVTISSDTGEGEVLARTSSPSGNCLLRPSDGTVRVTENTVVRARIDLDGVVAQLVLCDGFEALRALGQIRISFDPRKRIQVHLAARAAPLALLVAGDAQLIRYRYA